MSPIKVVRLSILNCAFYRSRQAKGRPTHWTSCRATKKETTVCTHIHTRELRVCNLPQMNVFGVKIHLLSLI